MESSVLQKGKQTFLTPSPQPKADDLPFTSTVKLFQAPHPSPLTCQPPSEHGLLGKPYSFVAGATACCFSVGGGKHLLL